MSTRRELANAIRALSMDAVQKANSGHPGAPMGMADIAEVLWNDYMHHNPKNPEWPNRDRFVLSNGHGSMLIYSLLHLTGYELPMEELKNFRQLHSKTPGHPEYGYTPGVETTTGPLGQGITNAVGMAIAEKMLAGQFNKPGHKVVDHYTYCFLGDGCLMEGISHEACSLAGTLGLGKLVAFYDDNGISIDGHVEGWFTDDTPKRFESYGWHVVSDVDGHDADAIDAAIREARSVNDKPTLICTKTVIGFGAPNLCGTHDCHGAALGDAEVKATRENIGWSHEPFVIPDDVYAGWDASEKGAKAEAEWNETFAAYEKAFPAEAAELKRRLNGDLPADFSDKMDALIKEIDAKGESIASRKASQAVITGLADMLPELVGGSADLAPSNLTTWKGCTALTATESDANYIHYGVREFGMSAIMNGMVLHGGLLPYAGTFLMFSEYARNALRMAGLMKIGSIFVYTHDSIGLGEDGPTHQPVEQIGTMRLIPRMQTWRPCDAVETAVAWKRAIIRRDAPTSLVFSRQGLPHQERTAEQIANIEKGGYILKDCDGTPDLILIATGSEVGLAMDAAEKLSDQKVRVVSMPCVEAFDAQDEAYRESVLPSSVTKRMAIEAGVTQGWYKYVGCDGKVFGLDTFGESAPAGDLFEFFGFTADRVAEEARKLG
ncbi:MULTISPECIES: transketolase [unclassified Guyparkeria]|uniref:transketolase n=1 Tax=unclassified Guyparkeria TaxID=2626246 RepID=UPI00073350EC|nr:MULTISPECIES: transketolase [unclassified Guyparkeria]KTG17999.1 transketolase [Guyparkeria sp. XI15]OAE89709.1 transketolase [Guyparkeria sp. WRN-7]